MNTEHQETKEKMRNKRTRESLTNSADIQKDIAIFIVTQSYHLEGICPRIWMIFLKIILKPTAVRNTVSSTRSYRDVLRGTDDGVYLLSSSDSSLLSDILDLSEILTTLRDRVVELKRNQEALRRILLGGASSATAKSDIIPRKRYRDSHYRRKRSRSRDRDHHANISVPALESITSLKISSSWWTFGSSMAMFLLIFICKEAITIPYYKLAIRCIISALVPLNKRWLAELKRSPRKRF